MYKSCVSTINTGFNETKKAKNHVKKRQRKRPGSKIRGVAWELRKPNSHVNFLCHLQIVFQKKESTKLARVQFFQNIYLYNFSSAWCIALNSNLSRWLVNKEPGTIIISVFYSNHAFCLGCNIRGTSIRKLESCPDNQLEALHSFVVKALR